MAEGQKSRRLARKERDRERHRREILESAERVFVQKGYHLATVEEIAQQAEFAVGTIYNFFENKEELFNEVLLKKAQDLMSRFEQDVLPIEDPYDAIAALIELRLTEFDEHREFIAMFFETTPGNRVDPTRNLPKVIQDMYSRYIDSVRDIFAKGTDVGEFDDVDPLYSALVLDGILNSFFGYWSRMGVEEPLNVRIEKMKEAVLSRISPVYNTRARPQSRRNRERQPSEGRRAAKPVRDAQASSTQSVSSTKTTTGSRR